MQQALTLTTLKEKVVPLLQQAGVVRSSLFGSYARGEAHATSDVDILVQLPEDRSLLDLVGLELQIQDVLQRKVDLLTYNSLHPLVKPFIEKDLIPLL